MEVEVKYSDYNGLKPIYGINEKSLRDFVIESLNRKLDEVAKQMLEALKCTSSQTKT